VCDCVSHYLDEQLFYSIKDVTMCYTEASLLRYDSMNQVPHSASKIENRNGILWYNVDEYGEGYETLVLDAVPSKEMSCFKLLTKEGKDYRKSYRPP
jgi:hypothetical protein